MFEVGKTYRLRDRNIQRAFLTVYVGKTMAMFEHNGINFYVGNSESGKYIEVKPKVTKRYWLIHHDNGHTTRWDSNPKSSWSPGCIAITEHTVTFEEGEGLN